MALPCLSADLKCYLCVSNISWEECEKKKVILVCRPKHNEVCITQHIVGHDQATDKGYKETFVKMCGQARLCTDKDCTKRGKTCQIDCCHSDLCNMATRRTAHVTNTLLGTVVVILCYLL
ncbi:hypothetical protein OS493_003281 [Desmophyllum pertusum]|uniref:UPAR/Ly6 domain-containing protein n=1 Tax=Desmophyllum pertusum TaxID=174260 RepID=A0A9W9YGT3_9CNID|nr:hypothetical protein OS493_003281 [Desmophyllum pertusum]